MAVHGPALIRERLCAVAVLAAITLAGSSMMGLLGCVPAATPPVESRPIAQKTPRSPDLPPLHQDEPEGAYHDQPTLPLTERYEGWLHAWNDRDLEGYLSYYTEDATRATSSMTYDKDTLRARMAEALAREWVRVDSASPTVTYIAEDLAELSAVQEYADSTGYDDYGIKEMRWEARDGTWFIAWEGFEARDRADGRVAAGTSGDSGPDSHPEYAAAAEIRSSIHVDDAHQRWLAAMEDGLDLYGNGDHEEALERFEEAAELASQASPSPGSTIDWAWGVGASRLGRTTLSTGSSSVLGLDLPLLSDRPSLRRLRGNWAASGLRTSWDWRGGTSWEPEYLRPSSPFFAENGSYCGELSELTGRPKTVSVQGYFRSDGTYVRSHYRSRPRR